MTWASLGRSKDWGDYPFIDGLPNVRQAATIISQNSKNIKFTQTMFSLMLVGVSILEMFIYDCKTRTSPPCF